MQQKNYNPVKHHLFVPRNPEKYRGDIPVVLRSRLEQKFATWCDNTNSIKYWGCECISIPYYNPVKKKVTKYYPDFVIGVETSNGYKIYIVEVKSEKETRIPKISKRKSLLNEQQTYRVNLAKWEACIRYCDKYNYEFKIVTEKKLG